MELTSKQGMRVKLSDDEYTEWRVRYGDLAHEKILNEAGRIAKHRKIIDCFRSQILTDEQKNQVNRLASILARQELIEQEICDQGYENYLIRSRRGGMMPESWDRIVSNATAAIGDIDIIPDTCDLQCAMEELGFFSDADVNYSKRIIGKNNWEILIPENWGETK